MILTVKVTNSLKGSVRLPSSKSYTIRSFIVASCGGFSKIINPSLSDDVNVAIRVAEVLGAKVIRQKKNIWKVCSLVKKRRLSHVNVGESGTVLRFILPLVALRQGKIKILGEGTLKKRPNAHLTKILRKMGAQISGRGSKETVPIKINGGQLKGGRFSIDGSLSSQFISALFIACPQLKENTYLNLQGRLVSQTYVRMTEQILKKAGIHIARHSQRNVYIKGGQKFKGLKNFTVPSDYGLAAFFLAAAALVKSQITLKGFLNDDLTQADGKILFILRKMGVRFLKTNQSIKITGPFHLKGGNFSLADAPDLVPIVTILALFAKGKTRLYDIAHVRAKESDRISDLRKELLKIGAKISETHNELVINPLPSYKQGILLNPHHDHRLAMSFCILGLRLGAKIKDVECIDKSYPAFVRDFRSLRARAY